MCIRDRSTIGDRSTTTIRTTQSTRDALAESQVSLRQTEQELQQSNEAIRAQQAKENRLQKLLTDQLNKGYITQEEFDAEFGETSNDVLQASQPVGTEEVTTENTSRGTPNGGPAASGKAATVTFRHY